MQINGAWAGWASGLKWYGLNDFTLRVEDIRSIDRMINGNEALIDYRVGVKINAWWNGVLNNRTDNDIQYVLLEHALK